VFYARLNTASAAASKLDEIIDSAVRDIVSQNTLQSIIRDSNLINEQLQASIEEERDLSISSDAFDQEEFQRALAQASINTSQPTIRQGRSQLSNLALESSKGLFEDFGIELIDLLVRHVRYSDDLIERVYDRMVSNRNAIADSTVPTVSRKNSSSSARWKTKPFRSYPKDTGKPRPSAVKPMPKLRESTHRPTPWTPISSSSGAPLKAIGELCDLPEDIVHRYGLL
jgi:hypothetical protein